MRKVTLETFYEGMQFFLQVSQFVSLHLLPTYRVHSYTIKLRFLISKKLRIFNFSKYESPNFFLCT